MNVEVIKSKIHRATITQADLMIIVAYASMEPEEAKTFKPSIIFPGNNNSIR